MSAESIDQRTQQITAQQMGDLVIACARLRAENEQYAAELKARDVTIDGLRLELDKLKAPPESS